MTIVLAVAPHPDDETLGCGGTLLRHIANGDRVHWLIVSDVSTELGFPKDLVDRRKGEILAVAAGFDFAKVHNLGLPPARLDTMAKGDIVAAIGKVMDSVYPEIVYVPFRGDIHTDHAIVFDAVASCTKWFRYPSIRRVLCYETVSETEFGLSPENSRFTPNIFVDIAAYIDRKIELAQMYQSEMADFPFPRSAESLRALAQVRGAAAGCQAAESFMLLKEIQK